jgi:hypothetical protein
MNGTTLSGSICYRLNDLIINVDAQAASKAIEDIKYVGKRAKLTSYRSNEKGETLEALSSGADLAIRAAIERYLVMLVEVI